MPNTESWSGKIRQSLRRELPADLPAKERKTRRILGIGLLSLVVTACFPSRTPSPTPTRLPVRKLQSPTPNRRPISGEEKGKPLSGEVPQIYERIYEMVLEKRKRRAVVDGEYLKRINPEINEGRFNLLMLGLDTKPEHEVYRADTILLISLDLRSNKAFLINIPRDLHAPEVDNLPGAAEFRDSPFRINAVTVFGDANDMRRIVEDATGLSQDMCFVWDFEGFVTLINNIGGIDVIIDEEFIKNYGWEFSNLGFFIKEGVNHLDGEVALYFSRVRQADTDSHRSQRSQRVAIAAAQKIVDNFKKNPLSALGFLNTLRNLQDQGHIQLASEFNLLDFSGLARSLIENQSAFKKLDMPTISTFDSWGDLVNEGVIPDDYWQKVVRGSRVNSDQPLDYWLPVREAVAKKIKLSPF